MHKDNDHLTTERKSRIWIKLLLISPWIWCCFLSLSLPYPSLTVACFSLSWLYCVSPPVWRKNKITTKKKWQKTKKKLWTKKGTKSVCGPTFTFNCTRGQSCRTPLPDDSSPDTDVGRGRLLFCKTLKSGVCTICAALLVWGRHKFNQESIVFRDCFSFKNNNLVLYVIDHPDPLSRPSCFLPPSPPSNALLLSSPSISPPPHKCC